MIVYLKKYFLFQIWSVFFVFEVSKDFKFLKILNKKVCSALNFQKFYLDLDFFVCYFFFTQVVPALVSIIMQVVLLKPSMHLVFDGIVIIVIILSITVRVIISVARKIIIVVIVDPVSREIIVGIIVPFKIIYVFLF